jgi:hypothetical protein
MVSLMVASTGLDPAFLKVTDVLVVNEHEASLLTGLPVATKYAIFDWGLRYKREAQDMCDLDPEFFSAHAYRGQCYKCPCSSKSFCCACLTERSVRQQRCGSRKKVSGTSS